MDDVTYRTLKPKATLASKFIKLFDYVTRFRELTGLSKRWLVQNSFLDLTLVLSGCLNDSVANLPTYQIAVLVMFLQCSSPVDQRLVHFLNIYYPSLQCL